MRTNPLLRALLSFRLLTFFAMSLLIENRGGVDKISRYVSHSDAEEAIGGLAVDLSPGQIFRKKVNLPILLTYRLILSTESHCRERTNKVRSGRFYRLYYLADHGPQVPPAQRISTAMQPTRKQGFQCGGAGNASRPHPLVHPCVTRSPPHLDTTRAESRASSA